jgi:hypothetical protein
MRVILSLIDQMIEKNQWEDNLNKKPNETGDNWNVYYLKLLKSMIIEESNKKDNLCQK